MFHNKGVVDFKFAGVQVGEYQYLEGIFTGLAYLCTKVDGYLLLRKGAGFWGESRFALL